MKIAGIVIPSAHRKPAGEGRRAQQQPKPYRQSMRYAAVVTNRRCYNHPQVVATHIETNEFDASYRRYVCGQCVPADTAARVDQPCSKPGHTGWEGKCPECLKEFESGRSTLIGTDPKGAESQRIVNPRSTSGVSAPALSMPSREAIATAEREIREMLDREHPDLDEKLRAKLAREGALKSLEVHRHEQATGQKAVIICACQHEQDQHVFGTGRCKDPQCECTEYRPHHVKANFQ